jgi:hypothetical protein
MAGLIAGAAAVNFSGQIFDRAVVKARRTKIQVKAFTPSEVAKGGIIEYSYTERFREKAPDFLKNPQDYAEAWRSRMWRFRRAS